MPTSDTSPSPAADATQARWFTDEIQVHDAALKAFLRNSFPAARHEVDDVVQESYLRVWKARAGRPIDSARAFLFRIASHLTLDHLRRRQVSRIEAIGNLGALQVVADAPDVAELVSMREKLSLLAAGLGTLPMRGRQIVVLRKLKGLSQREVAKQLGISEKTVDEHLYRGMKRLGRYLRQRGVSGHYEP